MVKGKNLVEEEQAGVGNLQFIGGNLGKFLNLTHYIVAEESDSSGRKWRQPGNLRRPVTTERLAQHGKHIALQLDGFLALGNGDGAASLHDPLIGIQADKGIAANFFAVLDRLQQKALRRFPGCPQKRRNGRQSL